MEAAFWRSCREIFRFAPRKAPITSRNFASLSRFHNYPAGRASGNHWGDALSLFVTSARSPYHFSLHASDPTDPEGGSRKDTGHTLICGPTGSGKTVFIGFLIAMLDRQGVTQVVFDKDDSRFWFVPWEGSTPTRKTVFQPASIPCSCRIRRPMSNSLSSVAESQHRVQCNCVAPAPCVRQLIWIKLCGVPANQLAPIH